MALAAARAVSPAWAAPAVSLRGWALAAARAVSRHGRRRRRGWRGGGAGGQPGMGGAGVARR
ncbi:MAG: hypothetical protein H6704_25295 [Myxococcales bacterium]|nr:hypothetical protein [Myxococcales bacterium]